ncbi:MAG: tetratricopeptide repeat protein, partial [Bacteroidota bacterium]|nr:tetratricopeptide repeat protein [Bacteroidota bacterium]
MNIKKIAIILFFTLLLSNVFSQENDETIIQFNYTNKLAYSENFTGAIRMYKQMISFNPQNPVFYYKLGFAYLNTINKADSAVINFKISNKLYTDKYRAEVSIWDIKFYLARAYRLNKNIDSSLMILENLRIDSHNKQFIENINNELIITRKSIDN